MTINDVASKLRTILDTSLRAPAATIPAIIMICSLVKRPGLSCALSTARIIDELGKMGVPTGPMEDGSANLVNQIVHKTVCEVFRALKEDANIQVAMSPGELVIQVTGANGGGPVTCVGTNMNAPKAVGLIQ